jgi:hypothetical protein
MSDRTHLVSLFSIEIEEAAENGMISFTKAVVVKKMTYKELIINRQFY